jgi:protein-S-isoprenylcysteine O-methyltransferase Ste14
MILFLRAFFPSLTAEAFARVTALYLPLSLALIAGILSRGRKRQLAATLLSTLWVLCTLLVLQRFNQLFGWWQFTTSGPLFRAMPIDLYLGWVVFWGVFPQLAFPRLALWRVLFFAAFFDIYFMPASRPLVVISRSWLYGEGVAMTLVLLPALLLARWTLQNTHLNLRAAMQIALSGMLFLFLLPEIAFAVRPGSGWQPLLHMASWQRQIGIQALLILALPGISAVMEFAQRGCGTPIPYDPPQRLVTSGVYRYCANPMQLSCSLVMLLWAALLHNRWFALAACVSIVYSAGIAGWDEGQDLATRFGADWKLYHSSVPSWRIRWRPFHLGPPAHLYIARTCGPCSELRAWLTARNPLGLDLIDAETLPFGSIRRLRYDPADGTPAVEGVRALGRALEHLNFGWALCGFALRLPLLWQSIQILMDASGLGPRVLGKTIEASR